MTSERGILAPDTSVSGRSNAPTDLTSPWNGNELALTIDVPSSDKPMNASPETDPTRMNRCPLNAMSFTLIASGHRCMFWPSSSVHHNSLASVANSQISLLPTRPQHADRAYVPAEPDKVTVLTMELPSYVNTMAGFPSPLLVEPPNAASVSLRAWHPPPASHNPWLGPANHTLRFVRSVV